MSNVKVLDVARELKDKPSASGNDVVRALESVNTQLESQAETVKKTGAVANKTARRNRRL